MTFTASNGVEVKPFEAFQGVRFAVADNDPAPSEFARAKRIVSYLDPRQVDALRECFQHERDAELGRWRFPRDPQFVVYPGYSPGEDQRIARVVHEHTGVATVVYEADGVGRSNHPAARAYFEAHPESKPWHDAKPGEAWVLTVDGVQFPWGVGSGVDLGRFVYLGGLSNIPLDHPSISAGERIWPKEES